MRQTLLRFTLAAAVLAAVASPALADPDPEIPVTLAVKLRVPGRYWFKYALFDRDGSDALDPGTEVWSEQMDTLGPRRRIRSRRVTHTLGSIAAPDGPLRAADFSQQLWVQAFRWRNATWIPCSARVKLRVQPYALFSSQSGGVTFSAPQAGFLNIPATALVGEGIVRHVGFGEAYLRTGNAQAWASQAVHLPHGATLTELRCWLRDDDAGYIRVTLERNVGPSTLNMASVSTQLLLDNPSTIELAETTIAGAVIDNSAYAYTLVAYLTGSENTADLSLNNCRLSYTVDGLAP